VAIVAEKENNSRSLFFLYLHLSMLAAPGARYLSVWSQTDRRAGDLGT